MEKVPLTLIRLLFLTVSIVTILGGITIYIFRRWPDNKVHLIFCNVGQGDALILSYRSVQILIDAGPDQSIADCLARHIFAWDKTLEVVFVTHPDKDHLAGFSTVFRHFKVKKIFLLGKGKSTRDFLEFRSGVIHLLSQGTEIQMASAGQQVAIPGKYHLKVISPREQSGTLRLFSPQITETELLDIINQQERTQKSINDESIATFLTIGGLKILLMADVEKPGELALLEGGVLTDVDVLKAGHHGSKTSTSEEFFAKVQPEFVVISSGKKNRYGHPHTEVIDRINSFHSHIFRTDIHGDVELIVNGSQFQWRTQHSEKKIQ